MKKTIKTFMLLAAGITACTACGSLTGEDGGDQGGNGQGTDELVLEISPKIIQANGTDAAKLTVLYNGTPVTEDVRLYDGDNSPVDLPDMSFSTEQSGEYTFWAAYGTLHTDPVTVTAIDFEVPELPADDDPENTAFAKKVLVTQFTGTGCGWCPGMITILRNVMADEEYSSRMLLAAAHRFNPNDPAYISAPLDQAMGVRGFPTVVADMYLSFSNYNNEAALRNVIDTAYEREFARAGISASSSLDGNTLVVRASVKAAETSEFRVGAWLLEDGINARQANNGYAGDFNTHDNCIRIADSKVSNINFTGHSLGTVKAGETAEYAFVMTLEDDWVAKNCHLILFVTAPDGNTWSVTNAVPCGLNETVGYLYE